MEYSSHQSSKKIQKQKGLENMNMEDYKIAKGNGCIYKGQASSGKTTKLCEKVKEAKNPIVLSFTNKAVENVKDRLKNPNLKKIWHTFDSYFCEWNDS